MKLPPPRRMPPHRAVMSTQSPPAALFPSGESSVPPPQREVKEPTDKGSRLPQFRLIYIAPFITLRLYPDGTAGAEAPAAIARMDAVIINAERFVRDQRENIKLVEEWLAAPKREKVEYRV